MAQIIPKHCYHLGWGGTTGYMSLNGGDFAGFFTFGANSVRMPVSCAGTFSNLSVYPDAAANPIFTFTLAVNNVSSALTVTVPAGATSPITDSTHTVSVSAGDDVSIIVTGSNDSTPSGDAGFSVQFTPSLDTLSTYGVTADAGSVANLDVALGGAFGNGVWQTSAGSKSNTYSIACIDGAVTRIDLKSMRGTFGGGNTFTCYILKNGVVQDGTGGTVNTGVVLDGASTSASGAFNLAISPGDLVDFYMVYAGADLIFANANIAVSCLFQSTTANVFHWCGGNNAGISDTSPTYVWIGSNQNTNDTEATTQTPVGSLGFTATALYVIHDSAGHNASATFTDTLRVNGADTAQSVTVQQLHNGANSGLISTPVILRPNDLIDVAIVPANTPSGAQFHWGVALSSSIPQPSYAVNAHVIRRLRRAPHIAALGNRIFIKRFLLDMQTGVGAVTGLGQTPVVMLRYSHDGGQTWSDEIEMSAGELGHYLTRVQAFALGQARDWVFEVTVSDPVSWSLMASALWLEEGLS